MASRFIFRYKFAAKGGETRKKLDPRGAELPFLSRHKISSAPEQKETVEVVVKSDRALVPTRLPKIEPGTQIGTRAVIGRGKQKRLHLGLATPSICFGREAFSLRMVASASRMSKIMLLMSQRTSIKSARLASR